MRNICIVNWLCFVLQIIYEHVRREPLDYILLAHNIVTWRKAIQGFGIFTTDISRNWIWGADFVNGCSIRQFFCIKNHKIWREMFEFNDIYLFLNFSHIYKVNNRLSIQEGTVIFSLLLSASFLLPILYFLSVPLLYVLSIYWSYFYIRLDSTPNISSVCVLGVWCCVPACLALQLQLTSLYLIQGFRVFLGTFQ